MYYLYIENKTVNIDLLSFQRLNIVFIQIRIELQHFRTKMLVNFRYNSCDSSKLFKTFQFSIAKLYGSIQF